MPRLGLELISERLPSVLARDAAVLALYTIAES